MTTTTTMMMKSVRSPQPRWYHCRKYFFIWCGTSGAP